MNTYLSSDIETILKPTNTQIADCRLPISLILTDSRKLIDPATTIFFAIQTKRNSGAKYVDELYKKGVRNFVLPAAIEHDVQYGFNRLAKANLFYVKDTVRALQILVANHRNRFDMPVIGITGSNGKTIVKDWIVQLLSDDRQIVSSPKSYNSQIGVPLSVWQMAEEHNLGVFEAGISEVGEMSNIQEVINPTIGIFTNIGQAHDENFINRKQKIAEKLQLFSHCQTLIYCTDHDDIHNMLSSIDVFRTKECFTWSAKHKEAKVLLKEIKSGSKSTLMKIDYCNIEQWVEIPFSDKASIENAMHSISLMLFMGYSLEQISARAKNLVPVAMRLELNEGINDCLLINDGYSLDLNSLVIALDFVQQEQQHSKKTLIMSDIIQTGIVETELYEGVAKLVEQKNITKFIGIGDALCRNKEKFSMESFFFSTTSDFLKHYLFSNFQSETILLKGARIFEFESIAKVLQRKSHQTIMEVNLEALVRNLNYFRSRISPNTKIMAMVKAFSYGAGNVEIANTLQFHNVDYLTVAYTDEGVELRKSGINLPIMVMNPEEESFDDIIKYNLEPDIYSFRILDDFVQTASLYCRNDERIPIHIELDTGMHRLGFMEDDISELVDRLKDAKAIEVKSFFSHLACSEDSEMDHFTRSQIEKFRKWSTSLKDQLGRKDVLCHILNSSGIVRFPEDEMDMVRLGIGLYGIAPDPEIQKQLTLISKLKTKISQIKSIPQGDSVGYNCKWIAERDSRIAIIPIGYADGLDRKLGNEVGKVLVNGKVAPIIGRICMDMSFVDVTDIECKETDEVVIFGDSDLLHQMADSIGTISYEILTSVSQRVKRVYFWE